MISYISILQQFYSVQAQRRSLLLNLGIDIDEAEIRKTSQSAINTFRTELIEQLGTVTAQSLTAARVQMVRVLNTFSRDASPVFSQVGQALQKEYTERIVDSAETIQDLRAEVLKFGRDAAAEIERVHKQQLVDREATRRAIDEEIAKVRQMNKLLKQQDDLVSRIFKTQATRGGGDAVSTVTPSRGVDPAVSRRELEKSVAELNERLREEQQLLKEFNENQKKAATTAKAAAIAYEKQARELAELTTKVKLLGGNTADVNRIMEIHRQQNVSVATAMRVWREETGRAGRATNDAARQVQRFNERMESAENQVLAAGNSVEKFRRRVDDLKRRGVRGFEAINQALKETNSSFGKFEQIGSKILITVGLLGSARFIAQDLFNMAAAVGQVSKEAAELKDAEVGFRRLASQTTNASVALKDIREAADGTIDNFTLLQTATKGALAGLPPSRFDEIIRGARALAAVTGRDVPDAVERLTEAITKQERRLLDELGIVVRANDLFEDYARKHDLVASSLTASQKQMAFLDGVLEQVNMKVASLGGILDDAQRPFREFEEAIRNARIAFGEWILENQVFQKLLKDMTDAAEGLGKIFETGEDQAANLRREIDTLREKTEALLKAGDTREANFLKELTDLKIKRLTRDVNALINPTRSSITLQQQRVDALTNLLKTVDDLDVVLPPDVKELLGIGDDGILSSRASQEQARRALEELFGRSSVLTNLRGETVVARDAVFEAIAASELQLKQLKTEAEGLRSLLDFEDAFKRTPGSFLPSGLPTQMEAKELAASQKLAISELEARLLKEGELESSRISQRIRLLQEFQDLAEEINLKGFDNTQQIANAEVQLVRALNKEKSDAEKDRLKELKRIEKESEVFAKKMKDNERFNIEAISETRKAEQKKLLDDRKKFEKELEDGEKKLIEGFLKNADVRLKALEKEKKAEQQAEKETDQRFKKFHKAEEDRIKRKQDADKAAREAIQKTEKEHEDLIQRIDNASAQLDQRFLTPFDRERFQIQDLIDELGRLAEAATNPEVIIAFRQLEEAAKDALDAIDTEEAVANWNKLVTDIQDSLLILTSALGGISSGFDETLGGIDKAIQGAAQGVFSILKKDAIGAFGGFVTLASGINSIITSQAEAARRQAQAEVDRQRELQQKMANIAAETGRAIGEAITQNMDVDFDKLVNQFVEAEVAKNIAEQMKTFLGPELTAIGETLGAQLLDPIAFAEQFPDIVEKRQKELIRQARPAGGREGPRELDPQEIEDLRILAAEQLKAERAGQDLTLQITEVGRKFQTVEPTLRGISNGISDLVGSTADSSLEDFIPTATFKSVTEPQANQMLVLMSQQVNLLTQISMNTSLLQHLVNGNAASTSAGAFTEQGLQHTGTGLANRILSTLGDKQDNQMIVSLGHVKQQDGIR